MPLGQLTGITGLNFATFRHGVRVEIPLKLAAARQAEAAVAVAAAEAADEAELRYIPLPREHYTEQKVLEAERSFLDKFAFAFNSSDNGGYRLTVASFWGAMGIEAMPLQLRRWVAEEWWYD